jgi:hypothetical protein
VADAKKKAWEPGPWAKIAMLSPEAEAENQPPDRKRLTLRALIFSCGFF